MKNHVENMAKAVAVAIEAATGDPADKAVIEAALAGYWKNRTADFWSVEDVLSLANGKYHLSDMTVDDARDILNRIVDDFDATIGINWDVIENGVLDYMERNLVEDTAS